MQRWKVLVVDEASFGKPHQLFDEKVKAFATIGEEREEGEGVVGEEGVEVLDEFAEAKGLLGEADTGFEGLEARVERGGYGEEERAIFTA